MTTHLAQACDEVIEAGQMLLGDVDTSAPKVFRDTP